MGLLDEAIRDHLDLKRRNGADPVEIERMEREALGPVRRGGDVEERPQFADEAPSANDAGDGLDMETRPLAVGDGFGSPVELAEPFDDEPLGLGEEPEFDEPKSHRRRRFGLFGRHHDEDEDGQPENQDFEYVSGEYILDEEFPDGPPPSVGSAPSAGSGVSEPAPSQPQRHDEAPADGYVAPVADEAPVAEPSPVAESSASAPSYESTAEPEPAPRPAVSYDDSDDPSRDSGLPKRPHFGTAASAQRSPEPPAAEPEPHEEPDFDPNATVQYRIPDNEPVVGDEDFSASSSPADDRYRDDDPPAASARPSLWQERDAEPERRPAASWADSPDDEPFADDELESPQHDQEPDEDVLEETPDFFQDAPDHDRLWFEQKPPKDFDFDG